MRKENMRIFVAHKKRQRRAWILRRMKILIGISRKLE
jgi:hypothetical protein